MRESAIYQELQAEARAEARAEVRQEGRQEEGRSLVLRQLNRRVGEISEVARSRIEALSLEQIEDLAEALLDFSIVEDLMHWFEENLEE